MLASESKRMRLDNGLCVDGIKAGDGTLDGTGAERRSDERLS